MITSNYWMVMNNMSPFRIRLFVSISIGWGLVFSLGAPVQADATITHRHYIGTIGSYRVQMDFGDDRMLSGVYFYERKGELIDLEGGIDAQGVIKLTEKSHDDDEAKITGSFKLKLGRADELAQLKGDWTPAGGGKSLPVKLTESLRYVATLISSDGQLIEEEPVFLDAFQSLHQQGIGHTIRSAQDVRVKRQSGELQHFTCLWHRPNVSLSLRKLWTENYGAGPGMGRADYVYDFENYRMVGGKALRLELQDFFMPGTGWKNAILRATDHNEDGDVAGLPFTLTEQGLRFHQWEAKFGDRPKLVAWKDLQDFMRPGWPQVLGVGPKLTYEVPQPGSSIRKAISDAVRTYEAEHNGAPSASKLLIHVLRVKDDWCYIHCDLLDAKADIEKPRDGDGTTYVLKKTGTKWAVKVEYIDGDPGSYETYKRQLPGVPDVILERFTMKDNPPVRQSAKQ